MKTRSDLLALILLAAPVLVRAQGAPAPEAQPTHKPATLLVLPLRAEAGLEGSARALDTLLLEALHRQGKYEVVGQSDIETLLGVEKLKDAAGCDDVGCAAELGGALGAPYLLAGQLGKLGGQVVLSLRLLDTKAPKVIGRGSARGANDADSLANMLSQALASLVGAAPAVAPAGAPSNAYEAYTQAISALGRRMSNYEYTALLKDIETYEGKSIVAPPGQEFSELLSYYRVLSCFMLRRPCTSTAAGLYLERWPGGTYASAVQSFVTQLEDEAFQRAAKKKELQGKLAEIEAQRKQQAGSSGFDMAASLSVEGYTCLGAFAFDQAAVAFGKALELAKNDETWFEYAQALVMVYERAGRFEEARSLLAKAQARDASAYRLRGMHQTLQRLPK